MARNVTTTGRSVAGGAAYYIADVLDDEKFLYVECPHCGEDTPMIPLADDVKVSSRRCNKCYRYYRVDFEYNTW